MRQIEMVMGDMNQLKVFEAKANLKKTWEDLFSLADIQDIDDELGHIEGSDPYHPVTILLLYICQM